MKSIQLNRVTFTYPPPGNIPLTLGIRKPDVKDYTILATGVLAKPDGTLVEPFMVGQVAEGSIVYVMAKTTGGKVVFEKVVQIPDEISWKGGNYVCEAVTVCRQGYTLSGDGSLCTKVETTAPTSSEQVVGAAPATNDVYGTFGTKLYEPGFNVDGDGTHTVLTTPEVWLKTADTAGPMNRCSIWVDANGDGIRDGLSSGKELTLTFSHYLNEPRRLYFGIGGDNQVRLTVNGVVIVNKSNPFTDTNFKWWHVYPVDLPAGFNLISVTGTGDGSMQDAVGMEIYDNTRDGLIGAISVTALGRIFDTLQTVGNPVRIMTCPEGYQPINNNGVWVCQRVSRETPQSKYTGKQIFTTRLRLKNGVEDGYSEPNVQDAKYIVPVDNPEVCGG